MYRHTHARTWDASVGLGRGAGALCEVISALGDSTRSGRFLAIGLGSPSGLGAVGGADTSAFNSADSIGGGGRPSS